MHILYRILGRFPIKTLQNILFPRHIYFSARSGFGQKTRKRNSVDFCHKKEKNTSSARKMSATDRSMRIYEHFYYAVKQLSFYK